MSKEPTIRQMNEAIALFMGYERYEDKYGIWFKKEGLIKCLHHKLQDLQYHASWDWLMPVVGKIEKMEWCVRVENWPKKFKSPYKELYSVWMWLDPEDCPEIQTYSDSKIEAVHNAVYQFITWYNQQPQTNGQNNGG